MRHAAIMSQRPVSAGPPVSTKAHESRALCSGRCFVNVCERRPGGRVQGGLRAGHGRPGRALHLRGLQQLPAGRPLAVRPRPQRPGPGPGGAARAARRLLGLHRLEGPLRQARVLAAAAQALAAAAHGAGLHARRCCCRGGISAAGAPPPSTQPWRKSTPSRPGRSISLAVRHAAPGAPARSRRRPSCSTRRTQADAALYLAAYENRLSSTVTAGENRGRTLAHDYVVLEWQGPLRLRAGRRGSRAPRAAPAAAGRAGAAPGWSPSCRTGAPPRCSRP